MEVVGDAGQEDVRTGQVVAVGRVAGSCDDLAQPVEALQLDVTVASGLEALPYPVDEPFARLQTVFCAAEVHLPAVDLSPVAGRRGRVDVVAVNDRVGQHHDDFPPRRGLPDAFGGPGDDLLQSVHAVSFGEPVVDELLPLLLAGCEAHVAQVARLVGVEPAVGTVRVLKLQEDESVEKPPFDARAVGAGDVGREPLLVPEVGRAVVASSVAQHGVGGAVGRSGALRACTFGQPGRPRHGKKDSCGKERQACGKKSLSDVHVVRSGHSRDPVVSPCRITTGSFGLNVHAAGSECFAPDVSQLAASAG